MSTEPHTTSKTTKRKSVNWQAIGRTATDIGLLALQGLIMGAASAAGAHVVGRSVSGGRAADAFEPVAPVVPMRKVN